MLHTLLSTRYPSQDADAFATLQRAFQGLERGLSEKSSGTTTRRAPVRLDARETSDAFYVSADLPGLTDKDIEVSFEDGVLSISGERKLVRDAEGDKWHITERSVGSFKRTLSLNADVDMTKIEAKFAQGVLTVTLPKKPEEPRNAHKIEIKSA